MIAEDMTQMGPVRAVDILDASQTMLNVIIRLLENGEIKERYDYLLPFYDVVSVDTGGQREKNEKLEGLKKLVKEYEQASDMVKEFV